MRAPTLRISFIMPRQPGVLPPEQTYGCHGYMRSATLGQPGKMLGRDITDRYERPSRSCRGRTLAQAQGQGSPRPFGSAARSLRRCS